MKTRVLDGLVDAYLARLDAALGGVPERRRRELVAGVGARIDAERLELPAESEAGVRAILDAIGPPEQLAAEERAFHPWSSRRSRLRRGAAAFVALSLVVGGSLTVVASVRSASVSTGARSGARSTGARSAGARGARARSQVTVPDLVGEPAARAAAALRDAHLLVGRTGAERNQAAAGTVVVERPTAGAVVPMGSRVDLEVSDGR